MTVEVRPAVAGDCARIPEFRRRMEGGAYLEALRDEAFYRRKYLQWGRARVAVAGDRILGIIAAVPRRTRLGGSVVASAEIGDLFVDPEFRGRGIFRRLHDGLLADLESAGVRLVSIRPGPEAEPMLRKAFGYRTLFGIAEWVAALREEGVRALPLGRIPVVRRALPRWKDPGPTPRDPACRVLDGDLPELPDAFGGPWPRAGTVRDAGWVRNRFREDPTPYRVHAADAGGRVVGVLITLLHAERPGTAPRGWLVDGWTRAGAEGAADALLRAALHDLGDRGAALAHFWSAREVPKGSDAFEAALGRTGFRRVARGKVVVGRVLGGDLSLPSAEQWMFRMGDTDGI